MKILCSRTLYAMKALMFLSSSSFNVLFCARRSFCWLIVLAYRLVVSVGGGLGVVFYGGFD